VQRAPGTLIRAKAPLRVSFGGGGTDLASYYEQHGGAVISATIDRFAYGTLVPKEGRDLTIRSLDFDVVAKFPGAEALRYDGNLDLPKAVVKNFHPEQGLDLFLHSEAPPGSGLGSSSSMVVALIGLFKHWRGLPLTDYEVAELAYNLERHDLGVPGGKQDQYAATFGGFNFIEFQRDTTIVNPLKIKGSVLNELQYRTLLVYTGKTRLSANIIQEQQERTRSGANLDALHETKALALRMKNALLQGKLDLLGQLLHEGWEAKRRFASRISSPEIEKLYEVARQHGALGGKVLGAGGGGYMLMYCDFERKHEVARELERLGARPSALRFETDGLQTWDVRP
jgi:D-glycero-alpha-D-manno-heptose-7-phosphate kinase